jgi:hypothetical protein
MNKSELRNRLDKRNAQELTELLLELADRVPRANRLIQLAISTSDEKIEVDADEIRRKANAALAATTGAFGRPDGRADVDMQKDMNAVVQQGHDFLRAQRVQAAVVVFRTVLKVLEENQHMLNPHSSWHRELRHQLEDLIYEHE